MTPTPETADIAGLVGFDAIDMDMIRNGDMLGPKLGARLATALQSLSAELAEAKRDLATKEHMWLYECEKHAEWLEKFMAEKARATAAEAEARAMREALEWSEDDENTAEFEAMVDEFHAELKRQQAFSVEKHGKIALGTGSFINIIQRYVLARARAAMGGDNG